MEPRFEMTNEMKIVGIKLCMSVASNKTFMLWNTFMPRRREIRNNIGNDLYSMQVYGHSYFDVYNPDSLFDKWAGIQVTDFDAVPDSMETYIIPKGLYAVFIHKGPASEGARTFQYIFGTWLPNSGYVVDDRPHFEILGGKYKNDSPDSEEEVWVPVKLKV